MMMKKKSLILFLAYSLFLIIPEVSANFTLSNSLLNITGNTGTFGTAFLNVSNILLNESINITLNTTTEGKSFLFFDSPILLDANGSKNFTIGYFIPPSVVSPHIYSFNVSFTSPNMSSLLNVSLDVKDTQPPSIGRCVVEPSRQLRAHQISIICNVWDIQSNVTNVFGFINSSKTGNGTFYFNKTGREEFRLNYTSFYPDNYTIDVFATDSSNNMQNYSTIPFIYEEWVPLTVKDVDFKRLRYNQTHIRDIVVSEEDIMVSITLISLKFRENISNTSISKVTVNDQPITVNETFNTTMRAGKNTISVYFDAFGTMDAILKFSVLDKDLFSYVTANFTYYTTPPDLYTEWLGYDVKCWSNDTGSYDTSNRICQYSFPIDSPISNQVGVLPIDILNIYNPQHLVVLEKENTSLKNWRVALILISILLLIGLIGYIIYENW